MTTVYSADHLTLEEIEQIVTQISQQWKSCLAGDVDENDPVYVEPDELEDEYEFWLGELDKRKDLSQELLWQHTTD